jgi:pantoate--beta-alanine ligase
MILIKETENFLALGPPREKCVLVPTMGALHAGHASLIRKARSIAGPQGEVVVSIFVNPTQFDRKEDLEHYPKTLTEDLELCESNGADYVFAPTTSEIYSHDHSISIAEKSLTKNLCGATRPGHFDGVCLVCMKLFQISRASDAVFGKKDYQQLAIIRRLVRDLNLHIRIHGAETVREDSGLALSSRNQNLSPAHRLYAPAIFQGLNMARQEHAYGLTDTTLLCALVRQHLSNLPFEVKIDYLDVVDAVSLEKLDSTEGKQAIMATAVFFGSVRLIDNLSLNFQG